MAQLKLKDVSEAMRDIDICMLTTTTANGTLESRPMSNNREVEYNGDSYFFSLDSTSAAREIKSNPQVNLGFSHPKFLGKNFYLSVTGKADLIYDKAILKQHWVKDLEIWFKDGIDTPGIVLIHVKSSRLKYWNGMDEGEISLTGPASAAA